METRGGLLGVTHRGPVEVADDESNGSTTIPQETSVVADILELYVRFRAKEDMMPREGWLELLEVTMPKLECRRPLTQIHGATRLSFVMMLVGSERDPPLASRAIAAMLVDHWCDKGPCSFLQKDAIRHATVACTELSRAPDGESIAQQLETGVQDALDGAGLEELKVFRREWSRERDVLFAGKAACMLKEFGDLAEACRGARDDAGARSILNDYMRQNKMPMFEADFMNWARAQLAKLPPTLVDHAVSDTTTPTAAVMAAAAAAAAASTELASSPEGEKQAWVAGAGGAGAGSGDRGG
ncbi:unnamed protein product [Pylaiella littoralis]